MEHFSTEGFTSLSPEELLTLDGGGLLTDLTSRLTIQLAQVVEVTKDITAVTGAFLKTIVGILV